MNYRDESLWWFESYVYVGGPEGGEPMVMVCGECGDMEERSTNLDVMGDEPPRIADLYKISKYGSIHD